MKMENSFEKNHESNGQHDSGNLDSLVTAIKNFADYQLLLSKTDNSIPSNIIIQDPLAQFLSVKREFVKKSLDEIAALIEEREQVKNSNIDKINQDICKVRTKMLNLSWQKYFIDSGTDKLYQTLQKQVIALNREKRAEDINCWRDVIRLKSDLRESLKEEAQEKRKQTLLSGK